MEQNNYLYFKQYKIKKKILQKNFRNIKKVLKSYMYIQKLEDGESIKLILNKKDKNKVMSYLIDELTNVHRIYNRASIEYLMSLDDEELKNVIEYLDNMIITLMKECQQDIVQMMKYKQQISEKIK